MSDERDLTGIERLLRSVPAPEEPPSALEALAREAALAQPARPMAARPVRRRQRFRLNRLLPAAAVVAAAAAASLMIGVGGRGTGLHVERTVTMAAVGPSAASGELQLGNASGAMRPVVLKVHGLAPQPSGRYYQMWFSNGGDKVAVIAFNTSANGSATVHSAIPTSMGWKRCWITLESEHDGSPARPVLREVAA